MPRDGSHFSRGNIITLVLLVLVAAFYLRGAWDALRAHRHNRTATPDAWRRGPALLNAWWHR